MGTDDLFHRRKIGRKERKAASRKMYGIQWLIVCEGAKTEPNYFRGLREHFSANSETRHFLDVQEVGEGKNTESLVRSVEKYFERVDEEYGAMSIPNGNIGVVFDRDSFGKGQFNHAIEMAEEQKRKYPGIEQYIPAWSNESFELWIYLHFHYTDSAMDRHLLNDKLTEIFRDAGLITGRQNYEKHVKTRESIFQDILRCGGDWRVAVQYAEKLDAQYHSQGTGYADHNPRTKVFELVRALADESGVPIK